MTGVQTCALPIYPRLDIGDEQAQQHDGQQERQAPAPDFELVTGMPVSTTQVLSSAVAGTMLVDGGGVQSKTVKNIMLAWVLTLPISILLSGGLYWIALKFI